MGKRRTLRKTKFSKKSGSKRSSSKRSNSKRSRSKRSGTKRKYYKKNSKQIFFHNKKTFRGGDVAKYPPVYGIENRAVLYPISKYGIPAGPFDPPALSNWANGNGPYPGVLYGTGGGRHKKSKRSKSKRSKSKKVRRSKYHGGSNSQSTFFPQPIVNTTRSLTGGLTELVNGFGGYTNSASLNPLPYDQPIDQNIKYIRTDFPNIAKDYTKADGYVSTL